MPSSPKEPGPRKRQLRRLIATKSSQCPAPLRSQAHRYESENSALSAENSSQCPAPLRSQAHSHSNLVSVLNLLVSMPSSPKEPGPRSSSCCWRYCFCIVSMPSSPKEPGPRNVKANVPVGAASQCPAPLRSQAHIPERRLSHESGIQCLNAQLP